MVMSDYTPTTDEVREDFAYPWEGFKQDREGRLAAFDRWLADHDREAAARALEEAADDWQRGEWANAPRRLDQVQERIANGQHVGDWIRARAARLTDTSEGS